MNDAVDDRGAAPDAATGTPTETGIAIIGTGFSGLAMAIALRKDGWHDFLVLESARDVGGTWRDNTYPGCGCDVPSPVYSFSFEPKPDWRRRYGSQPEIWQYMRHCAEKYGVRPHCRFHTTVESAAWDEVAQRWILRTAAGGVIRARYVVAGVGLLRIPRVPALKGIATFAGKSFHSTLWDHPYDLTGKRVAVIGTGASAIQFVPQIQPRVAQLHLFQRTPPWIFPKRDRPIKGWEQKLFRWLPVTQKLFRAKIFLDLERRIGLPLIEPERTRPLEALARQYLAHAVPDPVLRAKLTPSYAVGCKRILISNDYYPAVQQPNVEVITESIAEVRPHSIVTEDGTERPIDAIIYATGFKADELYSEMEVTGRGGLTLAKAWEQGPEAYYGVAVAGFPNYFMLHGPNTGTGHNSAVFMIEAQVRYVLACLKRMKRKGLASMEVKPEVQRAFNAAIQEQTRTSVWGAGGCDSWYLGKFHKNTSLWPGLTLKFWYDTRRVRQDAFIQIPATTASRS